LAGAGLVPVACTLFRRSIGGVGKHHQ
jgi:hypothetical protein